MKSIIQQEYIIYINGIQIERQFKQIKQFILFVFVGKIWLLLINHNEMTDRMNEWHEM